MLLGISGKMRSGKDTFAQRLITEHGFVRLAFADALKKLALDINPIITEGGLGFIRLEDVVESMGWEDAKSVPEVRRILQEVGTGVRDLNEDFWVNVVECQIMDLMADGLHVVVTDTRFVNEATMIKANNGHIVRIVRPNAENVNYANHISETSLDEWFELNEHFKVNNSSTLDALHIQADSVVNWK